MLFAFLVMQWLAALHPFFHAEVLSANASPLQFSPSEGKAGWQHFSAAHKEGSAECKGLQQLLHATPLLFALPPVLSIGSEETLAKIACHGFVGLAARYFQARAPPASRR